MRCTVVDPRWVKPVDPALAPLAARHRLVAVVEDNSRSRRGRFGGGAGAGRRRRRRTRAPVPASPSSSSRTPSAPRCSPTSVSRRSRSPGGSARAWPSAPWPSAPRPSVHRRVGAPAGEEAGDQAGDVRSVTPVQGEN
ncbi:hypothetical protein LV779_27610 [Streptomyces thinghirensis]|nr:hypothetical protein [Streptomyces thinghirensis]